MTVRLNLERGFQRITCVISVFLFITCALATFFEWQTARSLWDGAGEPQEPQPDYPLKVYEVGSGIIHRFLVGEKTPRMRISDLGAPVHRLPAGATAPEIKEALDKAKEAKQPTQGTEAEASRRTVKGLESPRTVEDVLGPRKKRIEDILDPEKPTIDDILGPPPQASQQTAKTLESFSDDELRASARDVERRQPASGLEDDMDLRGVGDRVTYVYQPASATTLSILYSRKAILQAEANGTLPPEVQAALSALRAHYQFPWPVSKPFTRWGPFAALTIGAALGPWIIFFTIRWIARGFKAQ